MRDGQCLLMVGPTMQNMTIFNKMRVGEIINYIFNDTCCVSCTVYLIYTFWTGIFLWSSKKKAFILVWFGWIECFTIICFKESLKNSPKCKSYDLLLPLTLFNRRFFLKKLFLFIYRSQNHIRYSFVNYIFIYYLIFN